STNRTSSIRCWRSPAAASPPPSASWSCSTASGTATSTRCSASSPTEARGAARLPRPAQAGPAAVRLAVAQQALQQLLRRAFLRLIPVRAPAIVVLRHRSGQVHAEDRAGGGLAAHAHVPFRVPGLLRV